MKTVEVRHPLVQHKIGLLRDASLSTKGFRELGKQAPQGEIEGEGVVKELQSLEPSGGLS